MKLQDRRIDMTVKKKILILVIVVALIVPITLVLAHSKSANESGDYAPGLGQQLSSAEHIGPINGKGANRGYESTDEFPDNQRGGGAKGGLGSSETRGTGQQGVARNSGGGYERAAGQQGADRIGTGPSDKAQEQRGVGRNADDKQGQLLAQGNGRTRNSDSATLQAGRQQGGLINDNRTIAGTRQGNGFGRFNNQAAGNYQNRTAQKEQQFESMETILDTIEPAALSDEEKESILFMLEEEKLARDVYSALYDKWGLPIFNNIASSEQTHMNDMMLLVERYELSNPVTEDNAGVFSNQDLKKLYTELTAKGLKSLEDALIVGATIEDLDIADLAAQRKASDNDDIAVVYQNLEKGSRNHLRSFTSQLERMGQTYTPQYISKEYFNAIVTSDREIGTMITDPDFRF
jgi:hypothetical protein